jgi:hypothetical protein
MDPLTYTDILSAAGGLFATLNVDIAIVAFMVVGIFGLMLRKAKSVGR